MRRPLAFRPLPLVVALVPLIVACSDTDAAGGGSAPGDASSEGSPTLDGSSAPSDAATEAGPGVVPARDRRGAEALAVRAIVPRDTEPGLREGDPVHLYVEAAAPAAGKLFVFLPGTGGPPFGYVRILKNAAMGGYDAVGLAYVNDVAVNSLCRPAEPTCHAEVREEVITGADLSPLVAVERVDSIEHRLVALLRHLGLERYLDGDAPRWESIAFAGHSQGGGHAAFLGKRHLVHRVVLFAATEAAPWTRAPGETPPLRHYGFMHTEDPLFAGFAPSWENLAIPGALTSVDGASAPFGGSQRLTTSLPATDGKPHNTPVVDPSTPMDGDEPVYRDVWAYLVGP
ncbi:MAG: hypothetical protein FJ104_01565 [Deltaproteobacteria bacterium]|nr:hypothetical protein [Deltaproteobacteria bacterium]